MQTTVSDHSTILNNTNLFQGFRIYDDNHGYRSGIESMPLKILSDGEVIIKTAYSSVNYKDALAGTGQGKILRQFPLNGGIDVAGHVIASTDPQFKEGDAVLVTGCGLSETRDGGYSEYLKLPAQWVIKLPQGLSLQDSMIIGTAGFTAALALYRMLENRQRPELGPIAITGATGGVGMLAVDIFSKAGFEVHAISGKTQHTEFLKEIGASEVVSRENLQYSRPMQSIQFGGALDSVGGNTLSALLASVVPYGNVASAGLAASAELSATVMPFIIRGVSLLGIASAGTEKSIREEIWQQLADNWKPQHLNKICTETIELNDLPRIFKRMLAGESFGRTLVNICST